MEVFKMEKKININELVNELVNELKEKVSDDAKRGTISINCGDLLCDFCVVSDYSGFSL